MGLLATANAGTEFSKAPAGSHAAICVQVIDMGTQISGFYVYTKGPKAGQPKEEYKVLVGWELPNEVNPDDAKPFLVWKRYTLGLGEKNTMRLHLEAWRGRKFTEDEMKGFHLANILEKPCMLSLSHTTRDGQTYTNVDAVMAMPKGMAVPARSHDRLMFDIEDWNDDVFATFSDGLKKKILSSPEAQARFTKAGIPMPKIESDGGAATAPQGAGVPDDDIPFSPDFSITMI